MIFFSILLLTFCIFLKLIWMGKTIMAGINIEGHWYTITYARYHSDYCSYSKESPISFSRKVPKHFPLLISMHCRILNVNRDTTTTLIQITRLSVLVIAKHSHKKSIKNYDKILFWAVYVLTFIVGNSIFH